MTATNHDLGHMVLVLRGQLRDVYTNGGFWAPEVYEEHKRAALATCDQARRMTEDRR